MKTLRLLYCLSLFLVMPLSTGCVITIGPYDDNDAIVDDNTSVLPNPPGNEAPPLDEAQQARQQEVDEYIATVIYQGATITQAIQLPSGDIIDGLDRNTLPALPYPLPALPWTPEDLVLPPGVELGLPDFEQYPELLDLVTRAAPFQRPDFSAYIMGETDAASIEDYLDRYRVGGAPSGNDRLYAGLRSHEPNLGMSGYMNQFHPKVDPETFSLMEFSVFCPEVGPEQEMVGVVIRSANMAGDDGRPRLHVEYARTKNGQIKYVWDAEDGQFVLNPFRRHRPGELVPVSVVAGKQVEHRMGIYQMPGTFDWWITYNDDVLGYYPGHLFTMLNGGACGSAWYAEVYKDPVKAKPGAPMTEMGSGLHGSAGPLLAAYVRNPKYYEPLYWLAVEPNDAIAMGPYEPLCYSRTKFENGLFYLGGDGGKKPSCIWPSP